MADSADQDDGLGLALVERREELGISRPDLARTSQLSYPYVYEIEKGRNVRPPRRWRVWPPHWS